MVPPRPRKQKADENAANFWLVKQNVRTLVDVLGQQRVLDNLARALSRIFKSDPPAGSAAVTFGSGSIITVTVGVEPNQPNRKAYSVLVKQATTETEVASSAEQPINDQLGSDYSAYNSAQTLKVKLNYREGTSTPKFVATFPANPTPNTTITLALNPVP